MNIPADSISLLTIAEAATIACVPQSTIRTWISRHHLASTRLSNGRVLVPERALLAYEQQRRRHTTPPQPHLQVQM